MLNPQLPLVDADGDASLSFSFRTDTLTVAGEYTVCAEYVETRDHLTRARPCSKPAADCTYALREVTGGYGYGKRRSWLERCTRDQRQPLRR